MRAAPLLILASSILLAGCAVTSPEVAPAPEPGPPPAPQPVAPQPPTADAHLRDLARARHCVALSMYWEARGEGQRGMAAVGSVIENRVRSRDFPDDHCSVVYQGGETPPCQFSWWCDGKSDRPRDRQQWLLALETAEELLAGRIADPTNGALYFHSTAIKRPWRKAQTAQIGRHLFYR